MYVAEADIAERLTRLFDGGGNPIGWKLVTRDDETELYDVNGRLTSVTTRSGLHHSLVYDGNGRLQTVTDDFGRQLVFTYSNDNFRRVATITNPAGGIYQFAYDTDENLTSVTYPDTKQRIYSYDAQSKLLWVKDEASVQFAPFAYDPSTQRVTSTEHAGGVDRYTISYSGLQRPSPTRC